MHLNSGVTGIEAARALVMLGVVHLRRRKLSEAADAFERCLVLTREVGDQAAEAATLTNLGLTMMDLGNYERARYYYGDALRTLRGKGQTAQLCGALCNAADVEVKSANERGIDDKTRQSCLEIASRYLDEANQLISQATPMILQSFWHVCGAYAFLCGDIEEAEANMLRAVTVCARHGLRHEATEATELLAEINLAKQLAPTAAKFLGLSAQIRKESGKTSTDPETERFGRLVARLYAQLDRGRANKLMRYGERLDLADILTPTIFNV
jgi:tetratricopeptide (TPR) repeat protein